MARLVRLFRLSVSLILRGMVRFITMVVLITICMFVFVTLQQLSAASAASLDASVVKDLGRTGTYRVRIDSEVTIADTALDSLVDHALADYATEPLTRVLEIGTVSLDCGTSRGVGNQALFVTPDQPSSRGNQDAAERLCLGGIDISKLASRTTQEESREFGTGYVIDDILSQTATITVGRLPSRIYVVTTGRTDDLTGVLNTAVAQGLTSAAAALSEDVTGRVLISRVDAGASVREAVVGVQLVYTVVGWGVLLVGAIGILLTESAVVRERNWFFGLVRTFGARRADIATVVLIDVIAVIVVAVGISTVVAVLSRGFLNQIARRTFGVALSLDARMVATLALGLVAIVVIGGLAPAIRATRLDPVDLLERS